MASGIFNRMKANALNKVIDFEADSFKMALLTNAYTFDADHNEWGDAGVSANEASGTGYTAGGKALTTLAVTQDDTNDRAKWSSDLVSWAGLTLTFRYAIIYDDTVAGDPLILCIDFGGDQTITAGTFEVTPHADGWFYNA